ncbi:MAG: helix-turn-helix transcriptional regulator [Deltaproteobacteria bacterium]|jgi:transcriptional regulator with XRE-family HTH domain|nr:helix-turn-helix transcriptional regulator [Deltaproteobacteria bacterium]
MDFGRLLRAHRQARGLSQLALGLEAEVSTRHLSFLESDRARPTREMVLRLAEALQVPLRARNDLLIGAGLAPEFKETPLESPDLSDMRALLELLIRRNQPYPAMVIDRRWDLVMANQAYAAIIGAQIGQELPAYQLLPPSKRPNILALFFDPAGFRPLVANWEEVARELVPRLRLESAQADPEVNSVLDPILARSDLPKPITPGPPRLMIPLRLHTPRGTCAFFTTLSTLGTPQDVTLAELRIECFHPADEETVRAWSW